MGSKGVIDSMDRDFKASNERQLVYCQGPHLVLGFALAMLSLAAICGTGTKILAEWPDIVPELLGGLVLSALILVVGLRLLNGRIIVLDKFGRQIIRSSTLLLWRRRITNSFSEFTSVSWKPLRNGESTKYSVQLLAPEGDVELFEVPCMDDARRFTGEIGEFLDLQQEHWDESLLKAEGKSRSESMSRVFSSLVGSQPMRCVFRSESRLVYARSFETLLKVFGWLGGPLGLLFLLSPWLGIKVGGMEDTSWVSVVVGAIFLVLSLVFSLGQRGVTIDRQEGFAGTWWGIGIPFGVTRRDLCSFSAVSLERAVEERAGHPQVLCRVLLVGNSGKNLVLFKSIDSEGPRTLAKEIAEFLNYPIVQTSPD
jgi:hypothetical protein